MRRSILVAMAGGLAAIGAIALTAFWLSRPTPLRVAVVRGSDDAQLIAAIAQNFAKTHETIRLRPVFVNDATASAAALESDSADLAVVRSDIRLPLNGQTLALMHRNAAILVATRASGVAHVADLRGHSVGIVKGPTTGTGNQRLFESILTQYEIPPKDVTVVTLPREKVFEALSSGEVSAVMTVGPLNTQAMQDVVTAATLASRSDLVFVPVSEAKAMAQRAPVFESMEIVRGAFGGAPPKPAEAFETLGVSVRLMAASTMSDGLAGEITRLLFSNRPAIAHLTPLANQIEAPSTDRGAAIPVHPGAAAYLDDEEQTFFDKYSDAIYIAAMVLSVLGSAAAALASRVTSRAPNEADSLLKRLLDVLRAARNADSLQALDALEQETDDILISGIAARKMRAADNQAISALSLALDQARLAIKDRRRYLQAVGPAGSGARVVPLDARSLGGY